MTANNNNSPRRIVLKSKCPTCSKLAVLAYRPFCSARCKDIDLSRWLSGRYAIPGDNVDEDEDGDAAHLIQAQRAATDSDDQDER
ncbi:MAG: DNA gyrase inhibitor YacG [Hyphomicrobiaceae bacterium]